MRFSAASILAFAAAVLAQNPSIDVFAPASGTEAVSGEKLTIQWRTTEDIADDVTFKIQLIGGQTQNTQVPIIEVASGLSNADGSFEWDIPSDIFGQNFYGLMVTSEANAEDWQFSNPFNIVEGDGSESDGAASTVTITTSSGTAIVTLSTVSSSESSSVVETTSSAVESISSAVEETSSSIPVESSSAVETSTSTSVTTTSSSTSSSFTTLITPSSSVPVPVPTNEPVIPSPSESAPSTVPSDNAAAKGTAGVFALFGGMAIAAML